MQMMTTERIHTQAIASLMLQQIQLCVDVAHRCPFSVVGGRCDVGGEQQWRCNRIPHLPKCEFLLRSSIEAFRERGALSSLMVLGIPSRSANLNFVESRGAMFRMSLGSCVSICPGVVLGQCLHYRVDCQSCYYYN